MAKQKVDQLPFVMQDPVCNLVNSWSDKTFSNDYERIIQFLSELNDLGIYLIKIDLE